MPGLDHLQDFYAACRGVNRFVALAAFGWLGYRTVRSWPAEWARPHHVWHYRTLLVLLTGALLAMGLGAILAERNAATPTPVSAFNSLLCLGVALLCWRWPRPHGWERDR